MEVTRATKTAFFHSAFSAGGCERHALVFDGPAPLDRGPRECSACFRPRGDPPSLGRGGGGGWSRQQMVRSCTLTFYVNAHVFIPPRRSMRDGTRASHDGQMVHVRSGGSSGRGGRKRVRLQREGGGEPRRLGGGGRGGRCEGRGGEDRCWRWRTVCVLGIWRREKRERARGNLQR